MAKKKDGGSNSGSKILDTEIDDYNKKWDKYLSEGVILILSIVFWLVVLVILLIYFHNLCIAFVLYTLFAGIVLVILEGEVGVLGLIIFAPILLTVGLPIAIIFGVLFGIKKLNHPTLAKIRKKKLKSL